MESLRIYPPVPMTVRKANKSDHVDGTFIPKGTLLNIVASHVRVFLLSMLLYITRFG